MTATKGFPKGFVEGFPKGFLRGVAGRVTGTLFPTTATQPHLATQPQGTYNSTQRHHHLKPRRGLEESKTYSVISRNSNGPIGEEMTR